MYIIVDNFDSPGQRINGNSNWSVTCDPPHRNAKLIRPPGVKLLVEVQRTMADVSPDNFGSLTIWIVYPPPRLLISHFGSSDANHKRGIPTYKTPPLSKVSGRATTQPPCVYLDIDVGLRLDVLDLVDP